MNPCMCTPPNSYLYVYMPLLFFQGVLPHGIDVKGLPIGNHTIHVSATDVFGSTAETNFEYRGKFLL